MHVHAPHAHTHTPPPFLHWFGAWRNTVCAAGWSCFVLASNSHNDQYTIPHLKELHNSMILVKVSTNCLLVKLKKLHTIAISVSTICLLVEELHIIAILVSTTCLLCLRYVGPSKQLGVNQLFAWAHISQPVCIVFWGPCLHNDMGLGCLPMFLGCSSPTYLCVLIAGAPPDRVGVHHKNQQTAHSLIWTIKNTICKSVHLCVCVCVCVCVL